MVSVFLFLHCYSAYPRWPDCCILSQAMRRTREEEEMHRVTIIASLYRTARDRLRSLVRPQNTGGVVNIDLLMCALLAAPLGPPWCAFFHTLSQLHRQGNEYRKEYRPLWCVHWPRCVGRRGVGVEIRGSKSPTVATVAARTCMRWVRVQASEETPCRWHSTTKGWVQSAEIGSIMCYSYLPTPLHSISAYWPVPRQTGAFFYFSFPFFFYSSTRQKKRLNTAVKMNTKAFGIFIFIWWNFNSVFVTHFFFFQNVSIRNVTAGYWENPAMYLLETFLKTLINQCIYPLAFFVWRIYRLCSKILHQVHHKRVHEREL